jgi:hypothetical protein
MAVARDDLKCPPILRGLTMRLGKAWRTAQKTTVELTWKNFEHGLARCPTPICFT